MKTGFLTIGLLVTLELFGQAYVTGGNTRHRFAQLNMGLDARTISSWGSNVGALTSSGDLSFSELQPSTEIRAIIGGTHFWGHADFFVAFNVASINNNGFQTGVETGAKVYPWRLENKKIRPYLGVSWLTTSYQQGRGSYLLQNRFPLLAGLTYSYQNHLVGLEAGLLTKSTHDYFITQNQIARTTMPQFWLGLSYKYVIETTLSAEKGWKDGTTKRNTQKLAEQKKLNNFTLAIGPSSAQFLQSSPYNASERPQLGQHKFTNIFLDFGLGYYWHRPDLQVNLAWRSNQSTQSAYGIAQTFKREALTLEAFKMLFDYHGFVPFIGPALSYEWLDVDVRDVSGTLETGKTTGFRPGITFGWDIRPNRLQLWTLRTNLRYFPNLNVNLPNEGLVRMSQLEFNFIQMVIHVDRFFL